VSKSDKDAALLRDAWERAQKTRIGNGLPRLSQKALAAKHDVTAGMVSHYMTGREPLNIEWQLRFAEYMDLRPITIWPDFPYKNLVSHDQEAMDLANDLRNLGQSDFDAVQSLVRSLPKKKA
jgi:hypothetical protein